MPADAGRIIYFTFQLFGFVTLPFLTCMFLFCPSVKRHPTMPNNTFLWSLSSLMGCLLLFTRQLDGPEPSHILCRAQSALTLSQPPAMSAGALSLVWKVWSLTWSVRTNAVVSKEPLWMSCLLLGIPWVLWGILAGIFAGVQTQSSVYRASFYCTSDIQVLGTVSSALTAMLLILCLAFQSWTVIIVYKRYRKSRRLSRAEVGDVSVPFLARIVAFMLFVLVALVLSFIATSNFSLEVPDIIIASIGVAIFFIFSSQEDVLIVWRIMRPRPRSGASADGHDEQSAREERPLSPLSPLSPVNITLGASPNSSSPDLPTASKNKHQLTVCLDQTELASNKHRFNSSIGDVESLRTAPSPVFQ